jgi:hypothetical protein
MAEIQENNPLAGKLKEEIISPIEPRCVETHGKASQSN